MITTVGGLIVGIIAMFAYNYLVMLVDRVVNKNGSSYDGIYGPLERACPKK